MYYETLTDLLNNDPAAYSLSQLRQAAADEQIQRRPGAF